MGEIDDDFIYFYFMCLRFYYFETICEFDTYDLC